MINKKIFNCERLVLDFMSRHAKPMSLAEISDGTGLSENGVKIALTYLDQNALLPEVSKIRSGKWGKSTKYQLLSKHVSLKDIKHQIREDAINFKRDVVKLTKKISNGRKHPQAEEIKEELAIIVAEMNNSFSLAVVGQLPRYNI